MTWLALSYALASQAPTAPASLSWPGAAGRLYTSPTLHVGVRPAADLSTDDWAIAVTVQVTTPALP